MKNRQKVDRRWQTIHPRDERDERRVVTRYGEMRFYVERRGAIPPLSPYQEPKVPFGGLSRKQKC